MRTHEGLVEQYGTYFFVLVMSLPQFVRRCEANSVSVESACHILWGGKGTGFKLLLGTAVVIDTVVILVHGVFTGTDYKFVQPLGCR